MKASEILRKAAEQVVSRSNGGCTAIFSSTCEDEDVKDRAYDYYASLFSNEELYWFGEPYLRRCGAIHVGNQNHRALALLLTADIAESIGD